MKTCIYSDKDFRSDYDEFVEILEAAERKIGSITTILYCADKRGSDKFIEKYATEYNIHTVQCPADWQDISGSGAKIKERVNSWTKKKEKYNASAGFIRDERMLGSADALIILSVDCLGVKRLLKMAENLNLKTYVHLEENSVLEGKIDF